mmetsp:Transcript_20184/g.47758  ORF Transcript_20184/g.47758 Transcript_20184/m.47758 type:complete len:379 (-) Transcript_20184:295-1431(-)
MVPWLLQHHGLHLWENTLRRHLALDVGPAPLHHVALGDGLEHLDGAINELQAHFSSTAAHQQRALKALDGGRHGPFGAQGHLPADRPLAHVDVRNGPFVRVARAGGNVVVHRGADPPVLLLHTTEEAVAYSKANAVQDRQGVGDVHRVRRFLHLVDPKPHGAALHQGVEKTGEEHPHDSGVQLLCDPGNQMLQLSIVADQLFEGYPAPIDLVRKLLQPALGAPQAQEHRVEGAADAGGADHQRSCAHGGLHDAIPAGAPAAVRLHPQAVDEEQPVGALHQRLQQAQQTQRPCQVLLLRFTQRQLLHLLGVVGLPSLLQGKDCQQVAKCEAGSFPAAYPGHGVGVVPQLLPVAGPGPSSIHRNTEVQEPHRLLRRKPAC